MIDENRLEALLEQAIVDCYDEVEEFWGIAATLEMHLNFPLQAQALGEPVEVIGLDNHRSSLRRGIMARVRKGEQEFPVALSELEFVDPDPTSAEWLAMYRYWLG